MKSWAISPSALPPMWPSCSRETGKFGFTDMYGARLQGTQKLTCELTLRNGKVVYDLNGLSRPDWEKLPKDYLQTGDPKWDGIMPRGGRGGTPRAAKQ